MPVVDINLACTANQAQGDEQRQGRRDRSSLTPVCTVRLHTLEKVDAADEVLEEVSCDILTVAACRCIGLIPEWYGPDGQPQRLYRHGRRRLGANTP